MEGQRGVACLRDPSLLLQLHPWQLMIWEMGIHGVMGNCNLKGWLSLNEQIGSLWEPWEFWSLGIRVKLAVGMGV